MYSLLFIILVFATAFERIIPVFNLWDEFLTAFVVVFVTYKSYKNNQWVEFLKKIRDDLFPFVLLIALGILGNVVRPEIQESVVAILKDMIAIAKFPVIMCFLRHGVHYFDTDKITKDTVKTSKVIIWVTLAAAIVGYFFDIGVYTGEIRFLNCFKFIFSHPTFLVSSYVLILAVFFAESAEKNRWYILLDCVIIFLSQRTKGYVVIAVALCFMFIKKEWVETLFKKEDGKLKINRKQVFIVGILLALIVFVVGKDRIMEHMKYGMTAARPALYMVGAMIAFEMFPLGSGLGTFASYLSGEYYSKIYDMYYISGVYGLTPDMFNYMADTFWPYIYGQFGVFGLIIYVKMILNIIVFQLVRLNDYHKILAFFITWGYILFASTAEAYFTSGTGVQMAIYLAIYLGVEKKETDGQINK